MTLSEVLRASRQYDPDGVLVITSRQACEVAAERLELFESVITAMVKHIDEGKVFKCSDREHGSLIAARELVATFDPPKNTEQGTPLGRLAHETGSVPSGGTEHGT